LHCTHWVDENIYCRKKVCSSSTTNGRKERRDRRGRKRTGFSSRKKVRALERSDSFSCLKRDTKEGQRKRVRQKAISPGKIDRRDCKRDWLRADEGISREERKE